MTYVVLRTFEINLSETVPTLAHAKIKRKKSKFTSLVHSRKKNPHTRIH